jgi:hypothetical protein
MNRAPVDQAEAPGLAAEKNVFRNRAQRNQIDFLVDGADAAIARGLRRGEIDFLITKMDPA